MGDVGSVLRALCQTAGRNRTVATAAPPFPPCNSALPPAQVHHPSTHSAGMAHSHPAAAGMPHLGGERLCAPAHSQDAAVYLGRCLGRQLLQSPRVGWQVEWQVGGWVRRREVGEKGEGSFTFLHAQCSLTHNASIKHAVRSHLEHNRLGQRRKVGAALAQQALWRPVQVDERYKLCTSGGQRHGGI